MRIERLTADQEARFGEFVERWTAIGLCTDPADRPRAEAAIRDAYRVAGRKEPERVVWCGSPLGQGLTRAIVLNPPAKTGELRRSVGASVWDSVWDSVGASVRDSGYGQHDASWLAFYAFFREVCDLRKQTEKLIPMTDLAGAAGWWLPHERICWVSERHNVCSLDDQQRLHDETGPAVEFPDGWAIWAWHGLRVAQQVIERPQELVASEILAERNVEVRRVMMERFGFGRLIRDTNAELLETDEFGKLWRVRVPGDEDIVMVEVVNSTPEPDGSYRDYVLRVPPTMRTPRAAVAWTFDVPEREYEMAAQS